MPGGKCRKCGCTSFDMDFFQGTANVLNWGVASAARIFSGAEKDESAALIDVCSFKLVNMFSYNGVSNLIGSKNVERKDDYITAYINGVFRPSYTILGFDDK